MAVPTGPRQLVDKNGTPIAVGSNVRIPGMPSPVPVHEADPRYGVLVVLVPGRAGQQMGQMVRASEVEAV
jgi:hypothetical protein